MAAPPPTLSHPQPQSLLQTALLSSKLHTLDLDRSTHRRGPSSDQTHDNSSDDGSDDAGSLVGVETPGRALSPASSAGGRGSSAAAKRVVGKAPSSGLGAGKDRTPTDPLRAFPNDVGIQIFARLDLKSLARCARVSKRWHQSQTINYIWYRHHKEHHFSHGEDPSALVARAARSGGLQTIPPAGRWGRKEAKDDWRRAYAHLVLAHPSSTLVPYDPVPSPYASSPPSPSSSAANLPPVKLGPLGAPVSSKNDSREQYRELKGRKARSKRGVGAGGVRDRSVGGFDGVQEDPYGDGRFDAPF